MPIGSAKIGVLGAGVVPGGTTTFNVSGTFTVPPGVKKVNITGKGGTGNPGNAGNAGNPGNIGIGAPGGQGGFLSNPGYPPGQQTVSQIPGAGLAMKGTNFSAPTLPQNAVVTNNNNVPIGPSPSSRICQNIALTSNPQSSNWVPASGGTGCAGNAGSAGNPGNAGNPGQASSGLCKTFPGGAGGAAGNAGAGGNGGTGGTGGSAAQATINQCVTNYSPAGGAGGNGGGSGGNGWSRTQGNCGTNQTQYSPPPLNFGVFTKTGGAGGGGASINSGQSGSNAKLASGNNWQLQNPCSYQAAVFAGGGTDPNTGFPACTNYNGCAYFAYKAPPTGTVQPTSGVSNNMIGGFGTIKLPSGGVLGSGAITHTIVCAPTGPTGAGIASGRLNNCYNLKTSQNPYNTSTNNMFRAGGGGGSGAIRRGIGLCTNPIACAGPALHSSGGGGGGGRGNAGNAGSTSPTPSGSAATPQTFNCVPVTPGSPYPITVASPGGQIVISWNPQ